MLDRDLAVLYGVETKQINRAVKRNEKRFPKQLMFQLTKDEWENLKYQFGTSSLHGGRRTNPYAFTEQGVAMLSAVLRSDLAVKVSLQIIDAFVEMRKYLLNNENILSRLDKVENKQFITDNNVNKLFNALEEKDIKPTQGIYYDGETFDAYLFVTKLIKSAKTSIVLIDNFIDETVLTILSKRSVKCSATIYTNKIDKQLKLDLEKHNSQYPLIEVQKFKKSHDRFLILDNTEIYQIGASIKDLGKTWFVFNKLEIDTLNFLNKLNTND